MARALLSKTRYIDGLQCPKLLWHAYNARDKIPPPDESTRALFEQGHEVGRYARMLFPDGILVEGAREYARILERSAALLPERRPLFEAAFSSAGLYSRADILVPASDGAWDIVEVKSSTRVKDIHCHDLAFQRHCYEGAGVRIARCYLAYINNRYLRKGPIEPAKLFRQDDMTERAVAYGGNIEARIEEMERVIARETSPDVRIGPHCDNPYSCPLKPVCWAFLPERNVATFYELKNTTVFALIDRGIHRIADVPEGTPLSHHQEIQRDCCRTGLPHVNTEGIAGFLKTLVFPLYFLDFETLSSAIPRYDDTHPFMQLPFQFSLHVWASPDTEPVHHAFLADGTVDPRSAVLRALENLIGREGSIIGYNVPFEAARIRECVDEFPDYAPWFAGLRHRFVDLLAPFKAFYYYHPAQDGSASIKDVLPPLTGHSYDDMEIADGGVACAEYARVTYGGVPAAERERVYAALRRYCELDTLGMVEIVKSFRALVEKDQ